MHQQQKPLQAPALPYVGAENDDYLTDYLPHNITGDNDPMNNDIDFAINIDIY